MKRVKIFGGWYWQAIETNRTVLENEINDWYLQKYELEEWKMYSVEIDDIFATNTIDPRLTNSKIVITAIVKYTATFSDYKVAYTEVDEVGTISVEWITYVDWFFYIPVLETPTTTFTFTDDAVWYTATLTNWVWAIAPTE